MRPSQGAQQVRAHGLHLSAVGGVVHLDPAGEDPPRGAVSDEAVDNVWVAGYGGRPPRVAQPPGVVPIDPFEGRELESVAIAPWPGAFGEFGLRPPEFGDRTCCDVRFLFER